MKILLLLLISAFSFSAFAVPTLEEEVQALKNTPRDYFDTGAICEEVARLEFQQEYQVPQYKVLTGIAYDNGDGTAGELDVIVFDNNTNKVIKIGEVKCWNDLKGALLKAKKQKARFFGNRDNAKNMEFKMTHGTETFTRDQFAYVNEFITIGPQGSKAAGFDYELAYSLRDLMNLREMMLKCQHDKKCASLK